jgi:hypothetical protein
MPRRDGQPTEEEVAAQRRGEGPLAVPVGVIPPAIAAAASLTATSAATATALAAPPAIAPVVAVGAINAAAAGIIGAFDRFLSSRRTDQEEYVNGLLEAEIPDLPEDARLEVVDGELAAEKAYAAKMRARLDHDLPLALSITEAPQREAAVQAILDRERHYMELRETAMASRALGAAEQRDVELKSPEGGYWHLSPHVKQHDLACLAMGGKVWPHSVLRQYHPPLHASCPCQVLTVDRARQDGLIGPDSFQSHDQSIYALQIAEAAWDEDELAEEMALLEAVQRRWWKGTTRAGQFRQRRGGDPGEVLRRARATRMQEFTSEEDEPPEEPESAEEPETPETEDEPVVDTPEEKPEADEQPPDDETPPATEEEETNSTDGEEQEQDGEEREDSDAGEE